MWIEINNADTLLAELKDVTPFTGVWIEILEDLIRSAQSTSHPSRVCGLKYDIRINICNYKRVTPFTGVWIEMS